MGSNGSRIMLWNEGYWFRVVLVGIVIASVFGNQLNSYFIVKMEVHMLSFIALIICFVGGIYFLCSGDPLFGILDIVLVCLNFKPAVEWLSTFI